MHPQGGRRVIGITIDIDDADWMVCKIDNYMPVRFDQKVVQSRFIFIIGHRIVPWSKQQIISAEEEKSWPVVQGTNEVYYFFVRHRVDNIVVVHEHRM